MTRLFPVRPTGITFGDRRDPDGCLRCPGTRGSAAYFVGDVLFVGDSADVSSEREILGSPSIFSDSQAENRASLTRLAGQLDEERLEVRAIVPAHSGAVEGSGALIAFSRAAR